MQYNSLGYKSTSGTFSSSFKPNSSLIYKLEKRGVLYNRENVKGINKNYTINNLSKVNNNKWNHELFNQVIEKLISQLDKLGTTQK